MGLIWFPPDLETLKNKCVITIVSCMVSPKEQCNKTLSLRKHVYSYVSRVRVYVCMGGGGEGVGIHSETFKKKFFIQDGQSMHLA